MSIFIEIDWLNSSVKWFGDEHSIDSMEMMSGSARGCVESYGADSWIQLHYTMVF